MTLPRGLMVWHLILDQEVIGSNPIEATRKKKKKAKPILYL